VGRNFAYVEIPDIANGIINKFPVVIDDGTVLMTQEDVEGIKKYIQGGGIFIAQHHTGQHLPERANAWPLASAFGLKVTPKYVNSSTVHHDWPLGKITFTDKPSLFPSLRGKQCEGRGVCIDWQGNEFTGAVGLSGADKDIAVANWVDDGSMALVDMHVGKGRLIILGTPFFYGLRDVGGKWMNKEENQGILDEFLSAVGVPRDSWTGSQEVWAERWVSKNGVYDLYPVARMSGQGEPSLKAVVSIRRETSVDELVEVSANKHPHVPVKWNDGRVCLPETAYDPMQCRLFAAPRPDLQDAALRWFDVQRRHWRALTPVSPPAKAEIKNMPEDILPVVADWKMNMDVSGDASWIQPGFADAGWKDIKLGSFTAMGLPDDSVARFRREIAVPEAWKGQVVKLVFDAETWWGIDQKGQLWIDGLPSAVKQPITKPYNGGSFTLDVTEQAKDGKITLALEVDGHLLDPKRKRIRPSGITGIFYLQAVTAPIATTPISGPWLAAKDVGVFHAQVKPGETAEYAYLETKFTLPKNWPAKRVFLESPSHLGWIILNNNVIQTPDDMRSLDVSGLVVREGENVLRWIPATPHFDRVFKQTVQDLNLVWTE